MIFTVCVCINIAHLKSGIGEFHNVRNLSLGHIRSIYSFNKGFNVIHDKSKMIQEEVILDQSGSVVSKSIARHKTSILGTDYDNNLIKTENQSEKAYSELEVLCCRQGVLGYKVLGQTLLTYNDYYTKFRRIDDNRRNDVWNSAWQMLIPFDLRDFDVLHRDNLLLTYGLKSEAKTYSDHDNYFGTSELRLWKLRKGEEPSSLRLKIDNLPFRLQRAFLINSQYCLLQGIAADVTDVQPNLSQVGPANGKSIYYRVILFDMINNAISSRYQYLTKVGKDDMVIDPERKHALIQTGDASLSIIRLPAIN